MTNVPMTNPEGMLALHEEDYGHSSSYVELENGDILHGVSCGRRTSADGGLTWSELFRHQTTEGDWVVSSGLVRLSGSGNGGLVRLPPHRASRGEAPGQSPDFCRGAVGGAGAHGERLQCRQSSEARAGSAAATSCASDAAWIASRWRASQWWRRARRSRAMSPLERPSSHIAGLSRVRIPEDCR